MYRQVIMPKLQEKNIETLVEVYRNIAKNATITSGRFLRPWDPKVISVVASWSQRNLERGHLIDFKTNYIADKISKNVVNLGPVDTSTEILSKLSRSESRRCVVRQITDGNVKKQYLEVWDNGSLLQNYDIAALDLHGDIYADAEFGTLEWSPDDSQVLYVAEKKKVKTEPFYKQKANGSENNCEKTAVKGEEYAYVEDWGEQLVGKSEPVAAICNVADGSLRLLEGIPDDICPGQLIWNAAGDGIYGIGVYNIPRRLGLVFCSNRRGVVFNLSLTGNFEILSSEGVTPSSCRLSDDGSVLVWLQRPTDEAHHACHELIRWNPKTRQVKTIVPIVNESKAAFLGIYQKFLPRRCFSKDGLSVIFNTFAKNEACAFSVNLDTMKLTAIRNNGYSVTVLDVYDDLMLIATSSLCESYGVYVENVPGSLPEMHLIISKGQTVLSSGLIEALDLVAPDKPSHTDCVDYNCLLLSPSMRNTDGNVPLIVFPHGGPHSVMVNSFMIEPAFYASIGMAVLLVNYRGSVGNGQDCVKTLLGHIGDLDVKDVQNAAEFVLKNRSYLDPNKVAVCGGSHGGFLALHLSGQYPDFYKAVTVRNPVVDLNSMYVLSDIPDWVSAESGTRYQFDETLSIEKRKIMNDMSANRYISKVKAPTLVLIGTLDLRVPAPQSIFYYNLLKARGVKTKLLSYNDNHSLSKVPVHLDATINSALWTLESFQSN